MSKLIFGKVEYSRDLNKRFFNSIDMAEIKRLEAIKNSQVKRGELVLKGNNEYVSNCSCGIGGCFFHGSYESLPKEQMDKWYEDKSQRKQEDIERTENRKKNRGKKNKEKSKRDHLMNSFR